MNKQHGSGDAGLTLHQHLIYFVEQRENTVQIN